MRALLAILVMAFMAAPVAHADGESPVWVSYNLPGAAALQARLEHQVRPGDGIVVHFLFDDDMPIPPHTIVITAAAGRNVSERVSVLADDGWMDQVTADDLLQRAKNVAVDPVDQVITFIRSVHAWQEKNPRPAPPTPPGPPNYSWLWWTVGIAGAALLAWLITWRVRVKRRQYAGLAQRADDPKYWERVIADLNKKVGE